MGKMFPDDARSFFVGDDLADAVQMGEGMATKRTSRNPMPRMNAQNRKVRNPMLK